MKAIHFRLALVPLAVLVSGCVVVPRSSPSYSSKSSAIRSDNHCPPGHRWSDGRCHSEGKGHDPDKHHGKHKGHDHHDDHDRQD